MEKLNFTYDSPANMVRLLITILFEKDEQALRNYGYAYHKIFDTHAGEKIFSQFMTEIMPDGGTIDEPQLKAILEKVIHHLETDEYALETQADYDKLRYDSYVYFKPYHKVYPCGFLGHFETVQDILTEYFRGIESYDIDKFKKFISDNFEIKSENTKISNIIANASFILRCCIMQ